MGRPQTLAAWAWLLLAVLALFVALSAAAQVRTTDTRWSFHLPLPSGRGPRAYAGVSDGRVLRWGGSAAGWTTFAHSASYRKIPLCTAGVVPSEETESICGRPLGLQFHAATGDLYIADAYLGLMRVGPGGGEAEVLAAGADGVPFNFVNGLDVDQSTGDVYFTDSSATYPRRFNAEIMMNADATGRLLKYDARFGRVAVLRSGLPYPNGVAVSPDGAHVVVAHTVPSQLLADLPGYPDNVRRDGRGGYWVALNQEKQRLDATPATAPLTAAKGVTLSDVAERKGQLWLGSVELEYVGLVA
ncbi:hypothetical protein PVAP13_5KG669107 [Panicum virgatum]|uniref:Strictosidine synthase conserved region domain-containing protein n=1 Tax=Panicum virgatum TaxID=38727 RepID=A0A8T0SVX4_PANVG|nr:hypothetical protein PVAP13_5KG669107 [Panicum virgatum]